MPEKPEIVIHNGKRCLYRYGAYWNPEHSDLAIEQECVELGGHWVNKRGTVFGNGPFWHYKHFQELAWPEDDHHEWSDLVLKAIVEPELLDPKYAGSSLTTIMGPKDSGKSYPLAKLALTDYWCHPDDTLILISSTELRGAGLRIWGAIKDLFSRAREKNDWLPGKVLESKNSITTDELSEKDVRDPRKGIVFVPMFGSGGQFLGLKQYSGVKQKRRWLIGDECQFMPQQYLNVPAALYSESEKIHERGTRCVFLGNPIGQGEPLDRFAEPELGWGTEDQSQRTKHWKNKFGGVTVNLVGTDSPNMHQPKLKPKKYPYMVGQSDIEWTKARYGEESSNFWQLAVGMRKANMLARRVISKALCEQFHALDDVLWEGTNTTRILGLDAAYGGVGGDRCVIVPGEFGKAIVQIPDDGEIRPGIISSPTRTILKVYPHIIVPVSVAREGLPEEQIVMFTKQTAERMGVPAENVFFDGRATLALTFSRLWSDAVNVVDFGGQATKRPVSMDYFIWDMNLRERRLKRCDEEYSKFVTELWFTIPLIVQSNQMRGLTNEMIDEGCQREWINVRGDRKEVETKTDMKLRTNESPDIFDGLVTMAEGARRRGFQISNLSNSDVSGTDKWLADAYRTQRDFRRRGQLQTY